MFEFFINLICLIKMMKKEIHWNIEEKRLHRKEIIFCVVESVEDHWVLENNFSNQTFKAFEAKSKTSKSNLMITNKKWHEILEHSRSKIIVHLAEKIDEIKVDDLESTSSINRCETCALIKTHEIASRRIDQKESIDHSLNRIDHDLISNNENTMMIIESVISFAFESKWISFTLILEKTTSSRWFENFWRRFRSNTIKSFDL
jgi:excinuclease UvrABC ATPase subunit